MKRGFTHFYYLISCPSDVQEELEIVLNVIDEINMTVGEDNGINIKCLYWKNNARPSSGENGQNIINKQLLSRADGIIALFWTKFGTPTEEYGSGTEEEIEKSILQGKNVMLYFSNKPINPDKIDYQQYVRVIEFKKRYSGLFAEYNTLDDFRQKLNRHILDLMSKLIEKEAIFSQHVVEQDMSLTEIMECGWFIRRFLLELPVNQESISIFQERIDKIVQLANRFELLNDRDLNLILSSKIKTGHKGVHSLSTEDIEESRKILDNVEISLMKKLKNRENASFQLGRCLGHILMLTEVIWSDNKNFNVSDFHNRYQSAFNDFINRAKIAAAVLNKDIEEIINSVEQIYSDGEKTCESAMNALRLSAEKITTILPLLSDIN